MTPEMIDKARQNKQKGNFENVEFRLGEIENLPVADEVADVVISNCVINLSPDKNRVFSEAFRALKPGGRLLVSDIVLLKELPDFIKNNESAYIGCLSGAIIMDDYLDAIKGAGFVDVKVIGKSEFPLKYITGDAAAEVIKDKMVISKEQIERLEDSILSIKVSGLKPAKGLNR
jgi:SAM-dependent methyltransferase